MEGMESMPAKVYARYDEAGRLLALGSDVFLDDLTGFTEIDEGEGDRYVHAQGHYLDGPVRDVDGAFLYGRGADGLPVPRTAEEVQADRDALPGPAPDYSAFLQGLMEGYGGE